MEEPLAPGEQPWVLGRHGRPVLFMGSSVCRGAFLPLEWLCYFRRRLFLLRVLSSSFLPCPS